MSLINRGHTYTEVVPASEDGAELISWLARRHAHSDADAWSARLMAGEISVDGVLLGQTCGLRRGQRVSWARPPWQEAEVPRDISYAHVDQDLLVVVKPAGLPTMPAGGFLENTLLAIVRMDHPEASPMHRLGRGTSGLVLFARTARARSALQASWREGGVDKVYRALVCGAPAWEQLTIEVPIGPVDHPRLGTVFAALDGGRWSRSDARILRRGADDSVVEVRITTGRPHQIRIHLAAMGHPLVGDPLYGLGGSPRSDALPGDLGYLLHAGFLAFPHPATGERVAVSVPPPELLRG